MVLYIKKQDVQLKRIKEMKKNEMKRKRFMTKFFAFAVSSMMLFASCASYNQMNNKTKSGILGGTGGAAIGAIIGGLIGHGKGAAIGAAVGAAAGTGTGLIIGSRMDKAAAEAAKIEGAKVEKTEANGVPVVKVTLDGSITFATGKSTLNQTAIQSLTTFARELDPALDLGIYGFTDNTGSLAINQKLSYARANSVAGFLMSHGIANIRIKEVKGFNWENPVASNATAMGRAQNRRVELYLIASEQMLKEAQEQAK